MSPGDSKPEALLDQLAPVIVLPAEDEHWDVIHFLFGFMKIVAKPKSLIIWGRKIIGKIRLFSSSGL